MKKVFLVIFFSSLILSNCKETKESVAEAPMKEFNCSFIGSKKDVSYFLGNNNIDAANVIVKVYGHVYMFSKENEPLNLYIHNTKTHFFETIRDKDLHNRLDIDRKLTMRIIDSSNTAFKMQVTSNQKGYRKFNNPIIVECQRK